jgi:hypothetical protein
MLLMPRLNNFRRDEDDAQGYDRLDRPLRRMHDTVREGGTQ